MLIYPSKRAVLLWPHESDGVRQCFPLVREVSYRGESVLALRHGIDETRVLRNLGVRVHSPILNYYDWPRGQSIEQPFHAQRETADRKSVV
jgi:hypothetical protein